jgi:hypothetical protein
MAKPTLDLREYSAILFPDGTFQGTSVMNTNINQMLGAITENQLPSVIDSSGTLTLIDLGVF